jgi:hypothetical protein
MRKSNRAQQRYTVKHRIIQRVVVMAATAVVMFLIASKGADAVVPVTRTVTPVGKYMAVIFPSGTGKAYETPLAVMNSGQFAFKDGPKGSWTEATGTISMEGKYDKVSFDFKVKQIGKNLGSPSERGTITEGGYQFGKWSASRL